MLGPLLGVGDEVLGERDVLVERLAPGSGPGDGVQLGAAVAAITRTLAEPGRARTSWVARISPSASETGTEISVKIPVTSRELGSAPLESSVV